MHVGPTRLVAGAVEFFEFAMCAFTWFYVNFSTSTYTSVKRGINKPRPNSELSGLIHRNYLSLVNSTKSYLVQLKNLLQVNKSDQISFPYLNQITRFCRGWRTDRRTDRQTDGRWHIRATAYMRKNRLSKWNKAVLNLKCNCIMCACVHQRSVIDCLQ